MKKRLTVLLAVVFFITVVALAFGKTYVVRDDWDGKLLWSSNEAYLFISMHRRGFQIGYWEYPWVLVEELLNGVRSLDDQRTSVSVVHMTTSGVDHHVVEMLDEQPGNAPNAYTPLQGYIYANCEGQLCKWNGNKFETATEEEQRRFDGTNQLTEKNIDKGWSNRDFWEASTDDQFVVDVSSDLKLKVTNKLLDRIRSRLAVEVLRPTEPPETIWSFDGRPRTVSKKEYEQAFARR